MGEYEKFAAIRLFFVAHGMDPSKIANLSNEARDYFYALAKEFEEIQENEAARIKQEVLEPMSEEMERAHKEQAKEEYKKLLYHSVG